MEHWHTARPVIRLYEVEDAATTTNSASIVRDIEVHGGVTTGTSTYLTHLVNTVPN